jgi:ribonuclease HI
MNTIEIFTDGACRGNPGPGGWGAVVRDQSGEKHLLGAVADTTNNRMELTATIMALESLAANSRASVTTDSQYVKNGITQWIHAWQRNGWQTSAKKPVKNADLWRQLLAVSTQHDVSWHWVKGHAGHAENELADQLANTAIDEYLRGEHASDRT